MLLFGFLPKAIETSSSMDSLFPERTDQIIYCSIQYSLFINFDIHECFLTEVSMSVLANVSCIPKNS